MVPASFDLLSVNKKVFDSGKYNFEGCRIQLEYNSGLKHQVFRRLLKGYEDYEICEFIEFGWPLGHNGSHTLANASKNHGGAVNNPDQVSKYVASEILLGRIIGPFQENPLTAQLAISPLNSLEKTGTSDRRVISDLSFPILGSVNSGINKDSYLGHEVKTCYPNVDCVSELIIKWGPGCLLFKRDMRKAFRQIRVDPGDIRLLGFKWGGKIYLDTVLAMGLRSAAYICQRLTNAIAFIYRKKGYAIVNYLDDFCGVEKASGAGEAFTYLGTLLASLGVQEATNKVVCPSSKVAFLGIWFDTVNMTMEVTPERLIEIRELTRVWLLKRSATLKEVQSLIGKLNFVAKCVKPARVFIGRMLTFLRGMNKWGSTTLTIEFKGDVHWWHRFLPYFNGIELIDKGQWSGPDEVIASDACLNGCGATCGSEFFHKVFPEAILRGNYHINVLELLSLVAAITVWSSNLTNRKVTVWCDNLATVWVINTGKTRDKIMQALLRELCFVTSVYHCEVSARHIPGVQNRVPDLLSRWGISASARRDFMLNESHAYSHEVSVSDSVFVTDCLYW